MQPVYRTIAAQALLLGVTVGAIGVSFGALAVAAGVTPAQACVMSLLVFAGGSQLAAVGVIGAGGSAVAAVAAGLVLNSRYVGFGLAIAPRFLADLSPARRAAAAHLLTDESAALALAQPDRRTARRAFWASGLALFVLWNVGTAVGAFAGASLGDPRAIGLDAAFPAGLVALLGPQLAGTRARIAAGAGAAIALACASILPPGLPVLFAIAGVALALRAPAAAEPAS